jgi:hypothetical protein
MQVMVCKKEIGWREQARKIIILATDRDFHYALDGKLVGKRFFNTYHPWFCYVVYNSRKFNGFNNCTLCPLLL